jgi:asparagine synthase (glutamine-hydrolysing)
MLQAIAHRGPDGQGTCSFQSASTGHEVFLGHRRLAIIDPQGAAQPMCDSDAGLALTFNGEIYNFRELREELNSFGHVFNRDSDTEVLLRAYQHWGSDVVRHLRGMFAFAIWDAGNERLFLARDRFGEKPLYLYEDESGLYFASEIKALLRIPGITPPVNLHAVWDYLAYRYVPGPQTLFSGIRKLMPGTVAIWERGKLKDERYWSAPDRSPGAFQLAQADAVENFLLRLSEAVKLQMVSDVPFGAFLSGGLDSSTMVALMSRHNSKVKTFSVGFAEDSYSELGFADEVARYFGTEHHELVVSERDLMDKLPRLVWFRDAPVAEPSDIPIYMLACEAARSVKMVLTGEGSDEILGVHSPPPRRAACPCASLRLSSRKDRRHESEHRGLARALRALVRCAEPQRARAPVGSAARRRTVRRCAAVRRGSEEQPTAAHPLLRPDQLAAGQPARAWRPHEHGGVDRGTRTLPRSRAGCICVLASGQLPRARIAHQMDFARGGQTTAAGAHPEAAKSGLPGSGESLVPRRDA